MKPSKSNILVGLYPLGQVKLILMQVYVKYSVQVKYAVGLLKSRREQTRVQ